MIRALTISQCQDQEYFLQDFPYSSYRFLGAGLTQDVGLEGGNGGIDPANCEDLGKLSL
jgi:hypothetical protein